MGKLFKKLLSILGCLLFILLISAFAEDSRRYVGPEVCKECHKEEYNNFFAYAKKSHSFESVKKMKKYLSESELHTCYKCHTTGYGKPGGFKSESETPELKNASCEVCHGPGSVHVETEDPKDINGKLTSKVCEQCHTTERVKIFTFRPMIYGGAH